MSNDTKMAFARTLADSISLSMNACEAYGMLSGCDEYCPVLNEGKCGIYKDVDEYLREKGED